MTEKEKNHNFIRQYCKLNIWNICLDLGLYTDYANIKRGKASAKKIKKVKKEIERRLKELEVDYENKI